MAPVIPIFHGQKVKLQRRGSSKAGRPRIDGDRYANGRLQPRRYNPRQRDESGEIFERIVRTSVYVIGPLLGPMKIGIAHDVGKRLIGIQTSSPADLIIHYHVEVGPTARAVEAAAHRDLAAYRLRGEWFDVPVSEAKAAIKRAIEAVRDSAAK